MQVPFLTEKDKERNIIIGAAFPELSELDKTMILIYATALRDKENMQMAAGERLNNKTMERGWQGAKWQKELPQV